VTKRDGRDGRDERDGCDGRDGRDGRDERDGCHVFMLPLNVIKIQRKALPELRITELSPPAVWICRLIIDPEAMIIKWISWLSGINFDYKEVKQGFHDYPYKIKQAPC